MAQDLTMEEFDFWYNYLQSDILQQSLVPNPYPMASHVDTTFNDNSLVTSTSHNSNYNPFHPMVSNIHPQSYTPGFVIGPSLSTPSVNGLSSRSEQSITNAGTTLDEGGMSSNGISPVDSQSEAMFVGDHRSPFVNYYQDTSGPHMHHFGSQFIHPQELTADSGPQERVTLPSSRKRTGNISQGQVEQASRRRRTKYRKRRQPPEQDDENVLIMRLRTKHFMEWARIAEELNIQRQEQGDDSHHTVASVYGRFVRNASRVSLALGEGPINPKDWMHINSEAQRQRPGVGAITGAGPGQASGSGSEGGRQTQDIVASASPAVMNGAEIILAQTAHDVFKHSGIWEAVAEEFFRRTGHQYSGERLRKQYEACYFTNGH